MKRELIDTSTNKPINIGDRVFTFRGEIVELTGYCEPQRIGSTGRVNVKYADGMTRELFPSVIGCEFGPI